MEMANLIQAISAVKTESSAGRAGKGQTDFSDKLAAALDHVTLTEKSGQKSAEPQNVETATDGKAAEGKVANKGAARSDKGEMTSDKDVAASGKNDDTTNKDAADVVKDIATTAVNMGMTWLQSPIVTPIAAVETVSAVTSAVSAVAQAATGTDLLGTAGKVLSNAGLVAENKTGKTDLTENALQTDGAAVNANQANAVAANQEILKTTVAAAGQNKETASVLPVHVESGEAGQQAQPAEISANSGNNVSAVMTNKTAEPAQTDAAATSGKPEVKTEIPATESTAVESNAQKTGSSQTGLIDPAIQKDVVAVNASTTPTVLSNTATAVKQGESETKTENKTQEPLNATEAVQETPVKANESKDSKQDLLGQFEKGNDKKIVEKTDESATPSVSFDKMNPVVDSSAPAQVKSPEQRADTYEVAKQVMEGMKSSTDRLQSSQVIITLKPEHLGEVTVKINVDGDRVTAAFHAASSEVRAILESSLPQLKQEMSQQGWNFDSDGVYGGLQQFMGNQQQKPQEQPVVQMPTRRSNEVYDDAVAFTGSGNIQIMSAAAVDYRI